MWTQPELFGPETAGSRRTPPWAAWVSVACATSHRELSVMTAVYAGGAARKELHAALTTFMRKLRARFRRPTLSETRGLAAQLNLWQMR